MCEWFGVFGRARGGSGRGEEPGPPPEVHKEGTQTHAQHPTSGPLPAAKPGKGEAKSGQSELLNWSSVEKGKRVSSLGKWPSPGWPQAPGLLLRWKKKLLK